MSTITFVEAKPAMAWYNYKTGQYDWMTGFPTTPTDYIPQDPIALNLYQLYIETGVDPNQAMINIFEIMVGNKKVLP